MTNDLQKSKDGDLFALARAAVDNGLTPKGNKLPDAPADRNGIPQGHHVHTILPGGFEILDGLLPGLSQQLRDGGSHIPEPEEFYFLGPAGRSYSQLLHMPDPPTSRTSEDGGYFQTRAWLEHCVRRHVSALPNVEIRDGTMVRELVIDGTRVRGVRTVEDGSELESDLVIDATGHGNNVKALRGKRSGGCLADAGARAGDNGHAGMSIWSSHRSNSSNCANSFP